MNTYWISLPCDLLSSLASFQCSLLHHLHLSSDLGLSKYVNQHSHLNLSRNVRLSVLYDLDFNKSCHAIRAIHASRKTLHFTPKSTPNTISLTYSTTVLFRPTNPCATKITFDFLLQISEFYFLFSVEPHGFPLSVCPLMKPPQNLPQKLSHRFGEANSCSL